MGVRFAHAVGDSRRQKFTGREMPDRKDAILPKPDAVSGTFFVR